MHFSVDVTGLLSSVAVNILGIGFHLFRSHFWKKEKKRMKNEIDFYRSKNGAMYIEE
jgi:hypothetical protein